MRLPIQYALTWPRRVEGPATPLDLCSCGPLTFAQPDLDTFRCLALALKAARTGGTAGAILNGANEAAVVSLFLDGTIGFLDIADRVERAMDQVKVVQDPTMTQILEGGPGGPGGRTVRMTKQIRSTTAQEVLCSISF